MDGTHTKLDENDATIFHSHPCSFLSMFPLSVAVFRSNCRFFFSGGGKKGTFWAIFQACFWCPTVFEIFRNNTGIEWLPEKIQPWRSQREGETPFVSFFAGVCPRKMTREQVPRPWGRG